MNGEPDKTQQQAPKPKPQDFNDLFYNYGKNQMDIYQMQQHGYDIDITDPDEFADANPHVAKIRDQNPEAYYSQMAQVQQMYRQVKEGKGFNMYQTSDWYAPNTYMSRALGIPEEYIMKGDVKIPHSKLVTYNMGKEMPWKTPDELIFADGVYLGQDKMWHKLDPRDFDQDKENKIEVKYEMGADGIPFVYGQERNPFELIEGDILRYEQGKVHNLSPRTRKSTFWGHTGEHAATQGGYGTLAHMFAGIANLTSYTRSIMGMKKASANYEKFGNFLNNSAIFRTHRNIDEEGMFDSATSTWWNLVNGAAQMGTIASVGALSSGLGVGAGASMWAASAMGGLEAAGAMDYQLQKEGVNRQDRAGLYVLYGTISTLVERLGPNALLGVGGSKGVGRMASALIKETLEKVPKETGKTFAKLSMAGKYNYLKRAVQNFNDKLYMATKNPKVAMPYKTAIGMGEEFGEEMVEGFGYHGVSSLYNIAAVNQARNVQERYNGTSFTETDSNVIMTDKYGKESKISKDEYRKIQDQRGVAEEVLNNGGRIESEFWQFEEGALAGITAGLFGIPMHFSSLFYKDYEHEQSKINKSEMALGLHIALHPQEKGEIYDMIRKEAAAGKMGSNAVDMNGNVVTRGAEQKTQADAYADAIINSIENYADIITTTGLTDPKILNEFGGEFGSILEDVISLHKQNRELQAQIKEDTSEADQKAIQDKIQANTEVIDNILNAKTEKGVNIAKRDKYLDHIFKSMDINRAGDNAVRDSQELIQMKREGKSKEDIEKKRKEIYQNAIVEASKNKTDDYLSYKEWKDVNDRLPEVVEAKTKEYADKIEELNKQRTELSEELDNISIFENFDEGKHKASFDAMYSWLEKASKVGVTQKLADKFTNLRNKFAANVERQLAELEEFTSEWSAGQILNRNLSFLGVKSEESTGVEELINDPKMPEKHAIYTEALMELLGDKVVDVVNGYKGYVDNQSPIEDMTVINKVQDANNQLAKIYGFLGQHAFLRDVLENNSDMAKYSPLTDATRIGKKLSADIVGYSPTIEEAEMARYESQALRDQRMMGLIDDKEYEQRELDMKRKDIQKYSGRLSLYSTYLSNIAMLASNSDAIRAAIQFTKQLKVSKANIYTLNNIISTFHSIFEGKEGFKELQDKIEELNKAAEEMNLDKVREDFSSSNISDEAKKDIIDKYEKEILAKIIDIEAMLFNNNMIGKKEIKKIYNSLQKTLNKENNAEQNLTSFNMQRDFDMKSFDIEFAEDVLKNIIPEIDLKHNNFIAYYTISYLTTVSRMDPNAFYTAYKNVINKKKDLDANDKIATLEQLIAIRQLTAFALSMKSGSHFSYHDLLSSGTSAKKTILNAIFTRAYQGVGKTKVIVKQFLDVYSEITGIEKKDIKIAIVGINSDNVADMKEVFKEYNIVSLRTYNDINNNKGSFENADMVISDEATTLSEQKLIKFKDEFTGQFPLIFMGDEGQIADVSSQIEMFPVSLVAEKTLPATDVRRTNIMIFHEMAEYYRNILFNIGNRNFSYPPAMYAVKNGKTYGARYIAPTDDAKNVLYDNWKKEVAKGEGRSILIFYSHKEAMAYRKRAEADGMSKNIEDIRSVEPLMGEENNISMSGMEADNVFLAIMPTDVQGGTEKIKTQKRGQAFLTGIGRAKKYLELIGTGKETKVDNLPGLELAQQSQEESTKHMIEENNMARERIVNHIENISVKGEYKKSTNTPETPVNEIDIFDTDPLFDENEVHAKSKEHIKALRKKKNGTAVTETDKLNETVSDESNEVVRLKRAIDLSIVRLALETNSTKRKAIEDRLFGDEGLIRKHNDAVIAKGGVEINSPEQYVNSMIFNIQNSPLLHELKSPLFIVNPSIDGKVPSISSDKLSGSPYALKIVGYSNGKPIVDIIEYKVVGNEATDNDLSEANMLSEYTKQKLSAYMYMLGQMGYKVNNIHITPLKSTGGVFDVMSTITVQVLNKSLLWSLNESQVSEEEVFATQEDMLNDMRTYNDDRYDVDVTYTSMAYGDSVVLKDFLYNKDGRYVLVDDGKGNESILPRDKFFEDYEVSNKSKHQHRFQKSAIKFEDQLLMSYGIIFTANNSFGFNKDNVDFVNRAKIFYAMAGKTVNVEYRESIDVYLDGKLTPLKHAIVNRLSDADVEEMAKMLNMSVEEFRKKDYDILSVDPTPEYAFGDNYKGKKVIEDKAALFNEYLETGSNETLDKIFTGFEGDDYANAINSYNRYRMGLIRKGHLGEDLGVKRIAHFDSGNTINNYQQPTEKWLTIDMFMDNLIEQEGSVPMSIDQNAEAEVRMINYDGKKKLFYVVKRNDPNSAFDDSEVIIPIEGRKIDAPYMKDMISEVKEKHEQIKKIEEDIQKIKDAEILNAEGIGQWSKEAKANIKNKNKEIAKTFKSIEALDWLNFNKSYFGEGKIQMGKSRITQIKEVFSDLHKQIYIDDKGYIVLRGRTLINKTENLLALLEKAQEDLSERSPYSDLRMNIRKIADGKWDLSNAITPAVAASYPYMYTTLPTNKVDESNMDDQKMEAPEIITKSKRGRGKKPLNRSEEGSVDRRVGREEVIESLDSWFGDTRFNDLREERPTEINKDSIGALHNFAIYLHSYDNGEFNYQTLRHESMHKLMVHHLRPDARNRILNEAEDMMRAKGHTGNISLRDKLEFISERFENEDNVDKKYGFLNRFMEFIKHLAYRLRLYNYTLPGLYTAFEAGMFRNSKGIYNMDNYDEDLSVLNRKIKRYNDYYYAVSKIGDVDNTNYIRDSFVGKKLRDNSFINKYPHRSNETLATAIWGTMNYFEQQANNNDKNKEYIFLNDGTVYDISKVKRLLEITDLYDDDKVDLEKTKISKRMADGIAMEYLLGRDKILIKTMLQSLMPNIDIDSMISAAITQGLVNKSSFKINKQQVWNRKENDEVHPGERMSDFLKFAIALTPVYSDIKILGGILKYSGKATNMKINYNSLHADLIDAAMLARVDTSNIPFINKVFNILFDRAKKTRGKKRIELLSFLAEFGHLKTENGQSNKIQSGLLYLVDNTDAVIRSFEGRGADFINRVNANIQNKVSALRIELFGALEQHLKSLTIRLQSHVHNGQLVRQTLSESNDIKQQMIISAVNKISDHNGYARDRYIEERKYKVKGKTVYRGDIPLFTLGKEGAVLNDILPIFFSLGITGKAFEMAIKQIETEQGKGIPYLKNMVYDILATIEANILITEKVQKQASEEDTPENITITEDKELAEQINRIYSTYKMETRGNGRYAMPSPGDLYKIWEELARYESEARSDNYIRSHFDVSGNVVYKFVNSSTFMDELQAGSNEFLNKYDSDNMITEMLNRGEITWTDENGDPCAKMGLTNTVKGTNWRIVKDFKGKPKHSQGGVDITIGNDGVTMRRGGKDIKAKHGLFIQNRQL